MTFLNNDGIFRYDAATDTFTPDRRWNLPDLAGYSLAPFTVNHDGAVYVQANHPTPPSHKACGRRAFPAPSEAPWPPDPRLTRLASGYRPLPHASHWPNPGSTRRASRSSPRRG